MPSKIVLVAGARPNFMKVAPLYRAAAAERALRPVLVHTGQHYDDSMSGQFFRDLGLPEPDHYLAAGGGSHAVQTAEIMKRFEPVIEQEGPAAVVVVGDVNSTIACALVAKKMHVPVVHVEAGLRSFDRTMPEEINRLATDAITDLFLVTEDSGLANLRREGVAEQRIRLVGNLMIDSLHWNLERGREAGVKAPASPYGLVTLHRPANVDSTDALTLLLDALGKISRELPLRFPVHPRTRERLKVIPLPEGSRIECLEPAGPVDFAVHLASAAVALTDSGGIQEETTALGVPCLTLRDNTERPITLELGTNILAGTTPESILAAWEKHKQKPKAGRVPPLWDGQAAGRAIAAIMEILK
jgi:UDP-N-acetylglucosamine 2-epimerase (non-hydrolysing)